MLFRSKPSGMPTSGATRRIPSRPYRSASRVHPAHPAGTEPQPRRAAHPRHYRWRTRRPDRLPPTGRRYPEQHAESRGCAQSRSGLSGLIRLARLHDDLGRRAGRGRTRGAPRGRASRSLWGRAAAAHRPSRHGGRANRREFRAGGFNGACHRWGRHEGRGCGDSLRPQGAGGGRRAARHERHDRLHRRRGASRRAARRRAPGAHRGRAAQ